MIKDFIARDASTNGALLGTTVRIDAQDFKTFAVGSNIYNGDGIGEFGAGFKEPDGIISVSHYTGKYQTPTLPLSRLLQEGKPNAGEMGVKLVDGPGGPASRLDITLPFVQ